MQEGTGARRRRIRVRREAIVDPTAQTATVPASNGAAAHSSRIFDIPIDLGRPAELLSRVTGWVGEGGPPRKVMYVNAHVLNQSQDSPELREALESADLVYCDGYGGRLAAKALDVAIPHP